MEGREGQWCEGARKKDRKEQNNGRRKSKGKSKTSASARASQSQISKMFGDCKPADSVTSVTLVSHS